MDSRAPVGTVPWARDTRRGILTERTYVSTDSPGPEGTEPEPTNDAGTSPEDAGSATQDSPEVEGRVEANPAAEVAPETSGIPTAPGGGDGAHYTPAHGPVSPGSEKNPWMWVAIGALVVAIFGGIAWAVTSSSSTPEPAPSPTVETISVPSVQGFTIEKATESLQGAGLVVGEITRKPSEQATGTILEQNPVSGTQVAQGSTVNLIVAGDANPKVPDLVGMSQTEAVNALIDAGLAQGDVTETDSPEAAGTVLTQSPAAGTSAKKGSKVNFSVATGTVAVPDVAGKSEAEATAELRNAGLDVTVQTREVSTAPAGVVIEQAPKAGQKVKTGTSIVITISASPPSPEPTSTPSPSPSQP